VDVKIELHGLGCAVVPRSEPASATA
jgi:hypothetical protein